jgi:transposase
MSSLVPYYLGIDVSKGYADFVLLDINKKIIEPNFQLDDTFDGHNQLVEFLEYFVSAHTNAMVYAAVESTGGYENNWYHTLHKFQEDFPIHVARLNPKGVKNHSEADLKRIITDKISAINIAEYMVNHSDKIRYETEDYFNGLRKKWNFIKTLTKQRTRLLNQLEKLMYSANPHILTYCKGGVNRWALTLIKLFPSARLLAEATVDAVSSIPYISKNRAVTLIDNAKISIASAKDYLIENTISIMAKEIIHLEELIKEQTQCLTDACKLPEVKLLMSFNSIGIVSAVGLVIEIGAIERFKSVKHLASYFGLHPVYKNSGDGIWGMHMSKQGRATPRAILYMVTMNAITYNPVIKEVFIHNLQKGKSKMDAMGVCMHKILRITYGMLKNNQPFDPDVDRKNRSRSIAKKKRTGKNKTRRYQKPDEKAPISRRYNKKRKEQEQSQNEKIIECGIIVPAPSHGGV